MNRQTGAGEYPSEPLRGLRRTSRFHQVMTLTSASTTKARQRLLGDWIRANSLACLVAVIAAAAVVGAGALVLSIADREDGLRETKTEVVELSRLVNGLREQTVAAFEGGPPEAADVGLHRQITAAALPTARALE